MALSDLFNKIESFDYNKVGTFQKGNLEDQLNSNPVDNLGSTNNPQTFEANGSIVTGEQSFDRPLTTPLPISEAIGFGPRSLLSDPQGVNFFGDVYAQGFLVNARDKETHYHILGDEVSNYDPSLGFQNTWVNNVFSFNDTPYTGQPTQVAEAVNPTPSVLTPGGITFKWENATKPFEVNFFDKDSESIHAIGFSANMELTKYKGILGNTYTSTSDTFKDTYIDTINLGIDATDPLTGDTTFFPNTNFSNGTFNIEDAAYRRQSGRISEMTSNDSNFINTTDEGDPTFLTDLLTNSKFTIKTSDNTYEYKQLSRNNDVGYPMDYVSAFIPGGPKGDVEVNPGEGLSEFGKIVSDKKGIGVSGRVMQIPVDGNTGRAIDGRSALSDPLRMGDGFVDYIQKMSGGNSQPFIVRRPGNDYGLDSMEDLGPSVAQNLIEGTGKIVNFLDEIAGGFVRGTPTFSGRIAREVDDILRKGKFLLTTEGITFGIKQLFLQANNRTIETRIWNPASLLSTPDFIKIPRHLGSIEYEGMLLNPKETIKDALPKFVPPFMADIFLEGLTGDRTPTSRVAEQVGWIGEQSQQAIPASSVESTQQDGPQVVLKSLLNDLSSVKQDVKKLIEGAPEPSPLRLPPKIDLMSTIGPVKPNITLMDKLKRTISKFSPGAVSSRLQSFGLGLIPDLSDLAITFHNPNHFYRFRGFGLFDIYGGPEDGLGAIEEAQRLKTRLTSGADRNTTITFVDDGSKLEELYNKANYKFLTYGQIGDGVSYEQGLKDKITGTQQEATRNAGVHGFLGQPIIEDSTGALIPPGANLLQEFDTDMNQSNYHDRVNAFPITETNNVPVDFVDFRFETFQYGTANVKKRRTIVFRASLNNVNENVQPNYSEVKYLGRPEKFYIYDGVDRDVNIDFTIYPKTAQEFPFLTEKLNYLVGLCYPQYSGEGLMIAPYVDLTLGDMFRRQPGYISNLAINVQDNTTWETEWFQFPKHITATLTFRYIGRHKPHQFGKHYDLPWLAQATDDGATLFADAQDTLGSSTEDGTPFETIVNRRAPEEIVRVEEFDIERMKSGWRGNTIKNLNKYDKQVTGRVPDPDNPGEFTTSVGEGDVFDNE